jgi:hypothetical protein
MTQYPTPNDLMRAAEDSMLVQDGGLKKGDDLFNQLATLTKQQPRLFESTPILREVRSQMRYRELRNSGARQTVTPA